MSERHSKGPLQPGDRAPNIMLETITVTGISPWGAAPAAGMVLWTPMNQEWSGYLAVPGSAPSGFRIGSLPPVVPANLLTKLGPQERIVR